MRTRYLFIGGKSDGKRYEIENAKQTVFVANQPDAIYRKHELAGKEFFLSDELCERDCVTLLLAHYRSK